MPWHEQVRNWSRPVGRIIMAIVVAYLFIVALLVSTAQQKVVEALAEQNVGYDYNVAIKYFFDPETLRKLRDANVGQLKKISTKLAGLEQQQVQQQQKVNVSFEMLLQSLRAVQACPVDLPAFVKDAAEREMALAAATEVSECRTQRSVASSLDDAIDANSAAAVNFVPDEVFDGMAKAVEDHFKKASRAEAALMEGALAVAAERENKAQLEEERTVLAKQAEMAAKSAEIMPMLGIFKNSRWPLVGPMVWVPPSLMAIFLAFTSGLFGALLITLVLFVYPEDKRFTFAKSESYAGRILLGGLIALGVFVLLFSGVSVLGDNGATSNTQNVMAYAAIGILSGMFSDKAAGWLSRQTHFGEDEKAER